VKRVKAFALQARFVYPVDRTPIENGIVTIDEDGWIVDVAASSRATDAQDLGDVALLPGLVNCHTHLEFSQLKRPLGRPGIRLDRWIRLLIAERGQASGRPEAIVAGLREGARDGVTMVGEIAAAAPEAYPPGRHQVMMLFAEVIGFSRARAESAYAALIERFNTLLTVSGAEVGISPHAPYTVSPDLLQRLVALANERVLPVAMHLAESEEELELLDSGSGPFQHLLEERSMWDPAAIPHGSRPMDYLRMLAAAPRALVIHGNYLDSQEHEFLAAKSERMSLIFCPRTHAYFRHPRYPLPELLAKNVRVALGTDSRASNPDLSLMAEMRQVAKTFPVIDRHQVLRMGTLSGAEALGREGVIGSITPGKLANLIAFPLDMRLATNAGQALESLMAGDTKPSTIWFYGHQENASDYDTR
jgi:cytosine/adenosine deaminase-related metal-dependent hydrolase